MSGTEGGQPEKAQEIDLQFREREIAVKEAEQRVKEQDLAFRRNEAKRLRWASPLIVAIFTTAAAVVGNAVVTLINGWQSQTLESTRSEAARILEMIKTADPDKAAENLRFLADSGLIENPERLKALRDYLEKRKPGSGPSLPYPTPAPPR